MTDKSGIDFDRQVFVQPQGAPLPPQGTRIGGLLLVIAMIVALVLLGYKLVQQNASYSGNADAATADIDRRLSTIETRLENLENSRRVAVPVKVERPARPPESSEKPTVKTVYRISPEPQTERQPIPTSAPDSRTVERLSNLQQGLGELQKSQAANQQAWQATTDRLADVAGQVGTQGVEILRSEDELNQLLARTEMQAIPFELLRGSNPQPVGPVSLVLKSANPKTQRYTICVYVQPSCVEWKNRTLYEVVQFVVSRNTPPLEVIATRIVKDEVVGYLEVPRERSAQ
jgi:hypothetical protein